MINTQERRFLTAPKVRSGQSADKKILTGFAARFDTLSEDLGGWRERLAPGCFRASLATGGDVKFLADHDSSKILGRTANKSLIIREQSEGLWFSAELPDTTVAADVYILCKRGFLTEMSFGFTCDDESWADEPNPEDRSRKVSVRTVKAASILEISAVAFPAYQKTSIGVDAAARSLFPGGLVPVEIRSRIAPPISDEEWLLRAHARVQLAKLG
jgi:HK97 family phage prohead protease